MFQVCRIFQRGCEYDSCAYLICIAVSLERCTLHEIPPWLQQAISENSKLSAQKLISFEAFSVVVSPDLKSNTSNNISSKT